MPLRTVTMNCRIADRFVGLYQIDVARAYEYAARSPWNDGRGETVWTFSDEQDRATARGLWRTAHPNDSI